MAKKKLFTFFLALAASVGTMFAESGTCGENLTWNLTDSVLTISGTGAMNDYSSSGSSKAKWYEYRYSIKSVIIGNGVTSIGQYAFYNCSKLTSVTIGNSLTYIGQYAFHTCSKLTSVTIPSCITNLEKFAFYKCTGLVSVTINSNSVIAKNYTTEDYLCKIFGSQVTEYIIGNNITNIGKNAFYACYKLTSIEIPHSVTSIGDAAFENCSGLTSITIPNSVTSIGAMAFAYCAGLTSMDVESGNTMYDSRDNCNAIIETATNTLIAGCQNTIIPNSVTSIGTSAFRGCTSLASIEIPNSVTNIGNNAFYACTGLTSVEILNGVTSIGEYAFYNCGFTSINIPSSVTSIGLHAFLYSALTRVNITDLVAWCNIEIAGENSSPLDQAQHLYLNDVEVTDLVIPESITNIKNYIFRHCTGLTSVTIPNSVTSIGYEAFAYCSGLTSITIPNSVTSIGTEAFQVCTGLTSVTCEALTPPSMGTSVFYKVNCSNIPLYVPAKSVSAYEAAYQWKDFNTISPIPGTIVPEYTITFVNWDGTPLLELPVEEGIVPEYTGATPSRPADKDYTYSFIGWSPDIVAATKDTTYTAQYVAIPVGQEPTATEEDKDVEVAATPTEEGSVILEWPAEENADTYTITIAKNGEVICTLVFDAEGRLISITFGAPARDGKGRNVPAAEKAAKGWRYEVKGLEPNTQYTYTVTATYDETVLYSETIDFTMPAPQGIDDVESGIKAQKLIRDNQVLILHGEKTYTVTGQEVK